MERIKKAIKKLGYNIGCISDISNLKDYQLLRIIRAIKMGNVPSRIELSSKLICDIEEPDYNNELDVIIYPTGYFD